MIVACSVFYGMYMIAIRRERDYVHVLTLKHWVDGNHYRV